jgi:hypothetical protein
MTEMMKEAIEALRELPEERQETIAREIVDYASRYDGVIISQTKNRQRFVQDSLSSSEAISHATKKFEPCTSASVYEGSVLATRAIPARVGVRISTRA